MQLARDPRALLGHRRVRPLLALLLEAIGALLGHRRVRPLAQTRAQRADPGSSAASRRSRSAISVRLARGLEGCVASRPGSVRGPEVGGTKLDKLTSGSKAPKKRGVRQATPRSSTIFTSPGPRSREENQLVPAPPVGTTPL